MSEKESECPCCGEMFTSNVNSCPNNIEDHKMCSECVEKSHKFFNSKAGCWYCGDREIKVAITNHRNEENSEIDQADKIILAMTKANEAFTRKASDLLFVQACGCEPCSQSKNLKLKIVAHKGTYVTQKIRNFEEISGEDVILTHRLLKNNIPSIEYWLVTKEFAKNLSKDNKRKFSPSSQSIENFGKIGLLLCEFNSGEPINTDVGKRSRAINWIIQASYFTKHTLKSPLRKI